MAVQPQAIKSQIQALLEQTKVLEQPQSQEAFQEGLANIITAAILSAQVTIAPGACIVVGSPSTQSNPAPILGTLS